MLAVATLVAGRLTVPVDSFVHLHVHSHFSILDGLGKPKSYAEKAAKLGQKALALTDHGSLSGAFQHWKECRRVGIKPIIGCEFYVAPAARGDKAPVSGFSGSGKYAHLTVLAENGAGLRNLYRLQARAYSEGFYGKPRIDFDLLEEYREGLIVLSGCAASHISTYLRHGLLEEAEALACRLRSSFGNRFFIEVMSHDIKEEDLDEAWLNETLFDLAYRNDIQVVATNDVHYCEAKDHGAQQALLCVSTQDVLSNPNRFQFNGHGFSLRSRTEMDATGLPAGSLDNSVVVADMVGSYDEVFAHALRMPRYSDDEGFDLEVSAWEGLAERQGVSEDHIGQNYKDRLSYELEVINSMGYPGYFLTLKRILDAGRDRGIVFGPGRGSAGGSLVAYALRITDLDPIPHNLVFERFLNPQRVSLPDIDIDVYDAQRPQLVDMIREMYGSDYVATIGTFGTIAAKAALKDANRVLGGTFTEGGEYCSKLPPAKFGKSPDLSAYNGPKDDVYRMAVSLEGTIRSTGQHAAGVIISPETLCDQIPLWHPAGQSQWVTGYDMKEVEGLGLTKIDFLGLRNLGVIHECMTYLPPMTLPLLPGECNDPATYRLLSEGKTLGVFQLDGAGMRGLLKLLKPKRFEDIAAVLALYRPGPMGANAHTEYAHRANASASWSSSWAIHDELEEALRPVLEGTYGLIVFQEQVLAVLNTVCGWSYAEAALLFDAMRKKNHEKMAATRPSYNEAGEARGHSPEALEALWETLVPFADYSFNRAHSAGYGLIAYWTAYLKANHPVEYMAALLSSVADDKDRLQEYLADCEQMWIELLPPDINVSGEGFTPDGGVIRYGLSAIRGVGTKVVDALKPARPFTGLWDFLQRAPMVALNSAVFSALVKSGALDGFSDRGDLYSASESVLKFATDMRKELALGQGLLAPPRYKIEGGEINRAEMEAEVLGVTLSYPEATLRVAGVLTPGDWEYIRRAVADNPGRIPLFVEFGVACMSLGKVSERGLENVLAVQQLKRQ